MDKKLFLDNLLGKNGVDAQETSLNEVMQMLDCNLVSAEVLELEEELAETEAMCEKLQYAIDDLHRKFMAAEEANRILKQQNGFAGGSLDDLLMGNQEILEYGESVN